MIDATRTKNNQQNSTKKYGKIIEDEVGDDGRKWTFIHNDVHDNIKKPQSVTLNGLLSGNPFETENDDE